MRKLIGITWGLIHEKYHKTAINYQALMISHVAWESDLIQTKTKTWTGVLQIPFLADYLQ